MSRYEMFVQLHGDRAPLLLGNCWDVHSAKLLEANGYKAIATSSAAVAASLGYEDGEHLPFEVLLRLAKRVVEVVRIPFSVDLEGGYSPTIDGLLGKIDQLHDAGVVGINLEDTIVNGVRRLRPAAEFQKTLLAVAAHLSRNNLKMFLNVRTDGFLLGLPTALAETLTRIESYNNAGAGGMFVPCITDRDDIKAVVEATDLPINVMCMPGLPDFAELASLGVKRISMGPFLFHKVYGNLGRILAAIAGDGNFSAILA